jgi:hypothetical protein
MTNPQNQTQKRFSYGDTVKLTDGLSAKVLADHGDEYIFVSIYISGWGDPHRHVLRTMIDGRK